MMKAIKRPVLVVTIFLIGIGGSLCLKKFVGLSEASFMVLVTISFIFSILLPNLNQLKSLSLTKGELILQEVKDSEAAVRELAIATVDLVEASSEFAIVTEEYDQDRYDKAVEKIRKLTNKT